VPYYQRGDAKIYYEQRGSGYPLLIIAPGGMNSTIEFWGRTQFNPVEIFPADFTVVAMDQRNAGHSSGPIDTEDGWDLMTDDQLGLMSHLGFEKFLVIGCCIGCSYIYRLIQKAPDRIVAGVMEQPIGVVPENKEQMAGAWKHWGAELREKNPDITQEQVEKFGKSIWEGEFVLSVSRDFAKTVKTPLLVMPGNDMAHPEATGLEVAEISQNTQLHTGWKDDIPNTVNVIRTFLKKHEPKS